MHALDTHTRSTRLVEGTQYIWSELSIFVLTYPGESASSQRSGVDPQTSSQGAPLTTGDISTLSHPLRDNDRVSPSVSYIIECVIHSCCLARCMQLRHHVLRHIILSVYIMCEKAY